LEFYAYSYSLRNLFQGQRWMNRTSICLTNSLLPVYQSYVSRCEDISDVGADGIIACNSRTDQDGQDFCSFVHDNSEEYLDIFGMEEIRRMLRLRKPGFVGFFYTYLDKVI
jgi:hypothetical protein